MKRPIRPTRPRLPCKKPFVNWHRITRSSNRILATTWNNEDNWHSRNTKSTAQNRPSAGARHLGRTLPSPPRAILFRSSLGGVWHNLSLVYEEQQQWVPATQALQAAIEHQQFAYEKARKVIDIDTSWNNIDATCHACVRRWNKPRSMPANGEGSRIMPLPTHTNRSAIPPCASAARGGASNCLNRAWSCRQRDPPGSCRPPIRSPTKPTCGWGRWKTSPSGMPRR